MNSHFLCLISGIHLLLLLDRGDGGSRAFGLRRRPSAPGSQALGLGLNYTTAFPAPPAQQIAVHGTLASVTSCANSCNKSYMVLFLWRTLTNTLSV